MGGMNPLLVPCFPKHNMQIDTKWNSGNFSLAHSAEVSEAQLPQLASLGLLYLAQRNRKHDETLGAFEKKDGKNVRKAGWKRGDVEFTPALASGLTVAYGYNFKLADGDKEVALEVLTDVTEYVRDTVESKFTFEKEIATARESLPQAEFDKWVTGIREYGQFADTHTEDGEDFSKEFLIAIRNKVNAIKRGV